MGSFVKDLRYGARMLASNPGFTLVAVLSLALGIGVNTTIFSIVNAVLLRPMPVAEPGELVEVYTSNSEGYPYGGNSFLDYADLRDQSDIFSGLISHFNTLASYNLLGPEDDGAGAHFPRHGDEHARGAVPGGSSSRAA